MDKDGDVCWHGNEGEEACGTWEFPAQTAIVHICDETPQDWWYNWLWLPRQDQLQEMLPYQGGEAKDNFWSVLSGLFEWPYNEKWLEYIPLSMEQLWLAFVMRERFGKVWSRTEWVKAEGNI